jgi:hypothetical protein
MTNYNERLDEILYDYWARHRGCEEGCQSPDGGEITKQAITSLYKELVAEAKPEEYEDYYASNPVEKGRKMGYNEATREFEQNLLKALEEL